MRTCGNKLLEPCRKRKDGEKPKRFEKHEHVENEEPGGKAEIYEAQSQAAVLAERVNHVRKDALVDDNKLSEARHGAKAGKQDELRGGWEQVYSGSDHCGQKSGIRGRRV